MRKISTQSNYKIKNKHRLVTLMTIMVCTVMLLHTVCAHKPELEKGVDLIKKGEYQKAVVTLNRALTEDSLDPVLHYHLALAYTYMDSMLLSLQHYLKLTELGSNLKDDVQLKEIIAHAMNLEPYPASIIPMPLKNQFRGTFGPDGEKIAVAAAKSDVADIYLIKLDGTIVKRIIAGGMNTDPDFSPSGEQLVFVSDRDGDEELYLYDLKSQQTEKLTDNTVVDFSPSFSPDGSEIVFVSYMDRGWEIYKISLENKKIRRLTKNKYWDGFPKFSNDGKYITFSSKREASEDIYIMKKNGGDEKILYASPEADNDPLIFDSTLYFKSMQSGEWEIFKMDLRRKSCVRLTHNQYQDWNPRISKDGTKMLITRLVGKRWRLYFMNLSTPISSELLTTEINAWLKINTPSH
jgi:Tol biopolymer transport system component